MKIITHKDIVNLHIGSRVCYDWAEYMIRHKSEAQLPAKISLKPMEGAFCNVMPSIVKMQDGKKFGGVKIVTRYPHRVPTLDSKMILFDADSGEMKAILDADWITAMRTGAVAAHSVFTFAKAGFDSVGFIGLGNTARAAMQTLADMYGGSLTVKLLRYKGQEVLFEKRFSAYENLHFEYCDSVERVIQESQAVISSVTYFADDICADAAFHKGILLVPIHTRGFTNCDLFFDKVFADDENHVKGFKNFAKFKCFSEVSDVVNGNAVGRANTDERILVYNIGVAMHDVFFAANIYKKLENTHLGEADFASPTEKFWL